MSYSSKQTEDVPDTDLCRRDLVAPSGVPVGWGRLHLGPGTRKMHLSEFEENTAEQHPAFVPRMTRRVGIHMGGRRGGGYFTLFITGNNDLQYRSLELEEHDGL